MITPQYCHVMARYNAWQNKSLMASMGALDLDALLADRKAFFGSIFGTANHLLWGDQLWVARFDNGVGPECSIPESVNMHSDVQQFCDARMQTDARILRWAKKLTQMDLVGSLEWYSGSVKRDVSKPKATCITHFFNHQTHHRGQIHAMLTSAGISPGVTDLVFMPEEI